MAARTPKHSCRKLAAILVIFGGLAGCSLAFPLADYTSGRRASDAAADTQVINSPDAVVEVPETTSPTSIPFCETSDAAYCEDFDRGVTASSIGLISTALNGSVDIVPSDAASSPPNVLVAAIPFHDGGIGKAAIAITLPNAPKTSVTLQLRLRVQTEGSIALGGINFTNGTKQSAIIMVVGETSFYLQEQELPAPDGGALITHASNPGAPFRDVLRPMAIRVVKTASGFDVSLWVDGELKRQTALRPEFGFGSAMQLTLGISYDNGQVPRAPIETIDDVEVLID